MIWLATGFAPGSWLAESNPSCVTTAAASAGHKQRSRSPISDWPTWPKHGSRYKIHQSHRAVDSLSLACTDSPPLLHTPWQFSSSLDLYVCGKMLHCFMLALWPRTPRGRRAPSFILLRVNCCDRALRGPSLALCPLRSKEAALILSVLLNLATQTRL